MIGSIVVIRKVLWGGTQLRAAWMLPENGGRKFLENRTLVLPPGTSQEEFLMAKETLRALAEIDIENTYENQS